MCNTKRKWICLGILTVVALSLPVGIALGDSLGYTLNWWTVGGTISSTGGDYAIVGTVGQPDAGTMSGGDYTLAGGFWLDAAVQDNNIYLPLMLKN